MPKIEGPTLEEVDFYHALYIKQVERLFYEYRDKYDPTGIIEFRGESENRAKHDNKHYLPPPPKPNLWKL